MSFGAIKLSQEYKVSVRQKNLSKVRCKTSTDIYEEIGLTRIYKSFEHLLTKGESVMNSVELTQVLKNVFI